MVAVEGEAAVVYTVISYGYIRSMPQCVKFKLGLTSKRIDLKGKLKIHLLGTSVHPLTKYLSFTKSNLTNMFLLREFSTKQRLNVVLYIIGHHDIPSGQAHLEPLIPGPARINNSS